MASQGSPPKSPGRKEERKRRVIRDDILSILGEIRVEPGQALRQVEPAPIIYEKAKEFAKWAPNITNTGELYRFKMNFVYGTLIEDAWTRGVSLGDVKSHGVIEGWQNACKALLRYALNLHLAPKRPEFRRMKLSSSFYVYQVSKKLNHAERILVAMGYKQVNTSREVQELQYEGDVKISQVLETAADLVILHSELELVKELVDQVLESSQHYPQFVRITLEDILRLRAEDDLKYNDVWPALVGLVSTPYNQPPRDQQFECQGQPPVHHLGHHLSTDPQTESRLSFQGPHFIDRAGVSDRRRESAPVIGTPPIVPPIARDYHHSPQIPRVGGQPPRVKGHPQTQQNVGNSNKPPPNQQKRQEGPYGAEEIHDMLHGKAEQHNERPTDPPITSTIASPVSQPPLYDNLPLDPSALDVGKSPQDTMTEPPTLIHQDLPSPRDDVMRQSVPELDNRQKPQPQNVIYTHGPPVKMSTAQFNTQLANLYQQFPDLAAGQHYANIPGEGGPEAALVQGRTDSIDPDPMQLPEPVVSTREDLAKMNTFLESTRIMSINPEIKDVHSVHDDGYVGPHLESLLSPPQTQFHHPAFSDTENIEDKWKVHHSLKGTPTSPPVPTSPRQPHSFPSSSGSSKDKTSPGHSLGSEGTTEVQESPLPDIDDSKTLETHPETDNIGPRKPCVVPNSSETTTVQKPTPIPRKNVPFKLHSFDVLESKYPASSRAMSKSTSDSKLINMPHFNEPVPAIGPPPKTVPVPAPRRTLSPLLARKEATGKDRGDVSRGETPRERPSNIPGNLITSRISKGLLGKSQPTVGTSKVSATTPGRNLPQESSLDHGGERRHDMNKIENDLTLIQQGNGILTNECKSPGIEDKNWTCKYCTNMFNDIHANVCDICGRSRS